MASYLYKLCFDLGTAGDKLGNPTQSRHYREQARLLLEQSWPIRPASLLQRSSLAILKDLSTMQREGFDERPHQNNSRSSA